MTFYIAGSTRGLGKYLRKRFDCTSIDRPTDLLTDIDEVVELFNEGDCVILNAHANQLEYVEKLNTLKVHATPISLRMYCLIFIYLSPLVYNSHILASFDKNNFLELGISVFFSVMIGFILMALFNIQQYIEDPFDQEGFDDLKFDEMVVGDQEVLD